MKMVDDLKKMSIAELLAEMQKNVRELTAALNAGTAAVKECPSFGETVKCDICGIEICIEASTGTGDKCLCASCFKIWKREGEKAEIAWLNNQISNLSAEVARLKNEEEKSNGEGER
jgi:hypothetical protein